LLNKHTSFNWLSYKCFIFLLSFPTTNYWKFYQNRANKWFHCCIYLL